MLNIYVLYTSYDVLLSMAIAASYPKDDNLMLFVRIPNALKKIYGILSNIFPENNARYFAFEEENIEDSNIRNFFLKKQNIKLLEKEIKRQGPVGRIFYNQEWNVYTTYAVHLAQELNPSVTFNFLDDGIYTYVETIKKLKKPIERWADRLVYGEWHINHEIPGTLRENCTMWALFPHLLPGVYKNKDRVCIDMEPLFRQIDKTALMKETSTCEEFDIDAIIATDFNSSCTSDEYRNIITSIVTRCCAENYKTAIKRHPADDSCFNFTPDGYKTAELLACVPIELYYLRFRKSLKKVVGGLSTVLLTARAMLPEAEIESVVSMRYLECDENSAEILKLFSQVGVKITLIE